MEILFYALYRTPIEKALPSLLEKIYASQTKTHILCETDEQVEFLDDAIWTHSPLSFLPHGSAKTTLKGYESRQPIWLSSTENLANSPNVFISLRPNFFSEIGVKKYIFFYDLHKENHKNFELLQTKLNEQSKAFTIWTQQSDGSWKK